MVKTREHDAEAQLAEFIGSFYADPYGFIMAVFPWGEEKLSDGTPNPLKGKSGPEDWQKKILQDLGEHIKDNVVAYSIGLDMKVWRSAAASGHGVGKSALVAWIIYFLMSTRQDTRGVVTANTANQLETKTWPELAKWHRMAINKHWFNWTATSFSFSKYPEDQRKNYIVNALTVSEENTEAFAGLHNEGKTVFGIFDEASGIAPKLWEVVDGALTDGEGFFFAFGNPTRPDGAFADCFDKHRDLYSLYQVDSRSVSHTNKLALADIIKKYGEDSDEVRIRIKGEFPNQAFDGFIPVSIVRDAINRELHPDGGAAMIMAVDVARFGNDETVIGVRQGRDARTYEPRVIKKKSTTDVARIVAAEIKRIRPDAVVIESTGPGAGVVDTLRDMGFKVFEVHPGSKAHDFELFPNKRVECWDRMREWLETQGCISNDEGKPEDLSKQLTGIRYWYDKRTGKLALESKEDMKKRGLPSPDRADTLALTFAVSPQRRDQRRGLPGQGNRVMTQDDPLE